MERLQYLFFALLCCLSGGNVWAYSGGGRDTLKTAMGDRLIIPYEYTVSGNRLTIRLKPAIKRLGNENSKRYRKPEELTVVIFDRKGSFEDAAFSGELIPRAFIVPSGMSYSLSREGYYLLHESPDLNFIFRDDIDEADLSFPAYLAYHVRKGHYRLIASCGSLNIKTKVDCVSDLQSSSRNPSLLTERVESREKLSTVEIESDNSDVTRVLDCIANINARLPMEERLPMSESIEGDVRLLREWKYGVTDARLKERVNETLDAYEEKKRQLENAAEEAAQEEKKRMQEEIIAQNEAEAAQQKEDAEKNRKRSVWMIIGGGLVAAGAFVGNQLLQNHRNRKNQKDMMEMQQSLVRKAENEAKRRTIGKARSEMTHAVNKARGSAEKSIKKGVGKVTGKKMNKKNITI